MTQVSRYGHMLKVTVNGMRMRVTARYRVDGSVLNDTVEGRMLGAETTLEIDSPARRNSSRAWCATPSAAAS
jgi:hypothetical protein